MSFAHGRSQRSGSRRHSLASVIYQPKPDRIVGRNGCRSGRDDTNAIWTTRTVQRLGPQEDGLPSLPSLGLMLHRSEAQPEPATARLAAILLQSINSIPQIK